MKTLTSLPWASKSCACTPTHVDAHICPFKERLFLEDGSSILKLQHCWWSHGGNRFFLAALGARVPRAEILPTGSLAHHCLATGVLALRQGKLTRFSEAEHLNSHSGPHSPWESAEYIAFSKD